MKKIIILFLMCILILDSVNTYSSSTQEKLITIQSSPDMFDLVQQWTNKYCTSETGISRDMIRIEELNSGNLIENPPDLIFVSNRYYQNFDYKTALMLVVGRDIMVPVINSRNPFIEQISKKGITIDELTEMINNKDIRTWEPGKPDTEKIRFNYYQVSDKGAFNGFSQFNPFDVAGNDAIEVANLNELISSIQHDVNGFGICRLADIIVNPEDQSWVNNIAPLPIDKNANGKIDAFEKIYASPADFARGVWIGKYPRSLVNNFFVLAGDHPENAAEINFIKWLVTDGQELLSSNGYNELVYSEKKSNFNKLDKFRNTPPTIERRNYVVLKTVLFALIIAVLIIRIFLVSKKDKYPKRKDIQPSLPEIITESEIKLPEGLFFDKTHTWVFMEKEGLVKIGVDDFLQHVTGPLTSILLKEPGENLKKNDPLITLIQNGKRLNVYSPLAGKIVNINKKLIASPESLNIAPYTDGWVYTIKPSNYLREIQFLHMAEKYRIWLNNEINRLKDFLAAHTNIESFGKAQIAYQEGGEIQDHVLHNLGPEVWEDFQKKFIDTAALA